MIEQELAKNLESIAQRKRTSLIASLVSSLQQDEKEEAKKNEEDKKGKFMGVASLAGRSNFFFII